MGTKRAERAQLEAAASAESDFETALALYVAHCGGDVGKATVAQREAFDAAMVDFSAQLAVVLAAGGAEGDEE